MGHYLIVDDNIEFAENIAEILADDGHEVSVAPSGQQALQLIRQKRFDVVLTDMRMPVMGGAQLVQQLREIDPGMPAIVISAYVNDEEILQTLRQGVLAVLPKPLPIPRLMQLLKSARRNGLLVVVESDRAAVEELRESLRARGLTAVAASSLLEAEGFRALQPFAAVVDLLRGPGADSEAIRQAAARLAGIPLVAISGKDMILVAHADELLRKPFSTDALLGEIEYLYKERSQNS